MGEMGDVGHHQPAELQLSPFKPCDYAVGQYFQEVEAGGRGTDSSS